MVNSNWSYSPETPNLGQIRLFLEPCDLEIWRMTLKNNRAPLLSNIKLYASFHHHLSIQTGVTVRKPLSWVVTSVTLTFDLWPWPFAWTSLLSLVITPENFMMIRWEEHSEKGVRQTVRQTDRQTERGVLRAAWSQLKISMNLYISCKFNEWALNFSFQWHFAGCHENNGAWVWVGVGVGVGVCPNIPHAWHKHYPCQTFLQV